MQPTRKHSSAQYSASMININTTALSTFVSAAGPLFLTALLTPGIIRPSRELGTRQLTVHVTTAASDKCAPRTSGTRTLVAKCRTSVGVRWRSTGQLLPAPQPARWYGVKTAAPRLHSVPFVQFIQESLAAGTGFHAICRQSARLALPWMTNFCTSVVATIQELATHLCARVLCHSHTFSRARHVH